MGKKRKKRVKKPKPKKKTTERTDGRGNKLPTPKLTANARTIKTLMDSVGKRGNPKDYVVLAGCQLMDYRGTYEVRRGDGATVGVNEEMALIFKGDLHKIVGEAMASRFWNRKTRTRVAR